MQSPVPREKSPRLRGLEDRVSNWYDRRLAGAFGGWLKGVLDAHARKLARHLVDKGIVGNGDRVLDVGSGTAELLISLAEALPNSQLAGLDLSSEMTRHAQEKLERAGVAVRVRVAQGSAFALPFDEGTFDVALSTWVCKHFSDEALLVAWKEAYRVLRPGGSLVVTEFGHSLLPPATSIGRFATDAQKLRTRAELAASLITAGFQVRSLRVIRFLIPPLPKLGLCGEKPAPK